MTDLIVHPSHLDGELTVPPSKSQTMRAILFALIADGVSTIRAPLMSPDTDRALQICRQLGGEVQLNNQTLLIKGTAGKLNPVSEALDVGNSGILMRFFTALLASQSHRYQIIGDESVMNRPMEPLRVALEKMGVRFYQDGSFQGPILKLTTTVEGSDSQYVSALLMVASTFNEEAEIQVTKPGELPWVDLTLHWLDRLGVKYTRTGYTFYKVQGRLLQGFDYTVPGDFSTAAFPYAAGVITGGNVILHGLQEQEPQGDKLFFGMKLLEGGEFDLNACIDALPIAAVMGCYAKAPVRLFNAENARNKECDRIEVMSRELKKMGALIAEKVDGLEILPAPLSGAELDSHDDHRVALSLIVAALGAQSSSVISGCGCIDKTYPHFFESFARIGANIRAGLLSSVV